MEDKIKWQQELIRINLEFSKTLIEVKELLQKNLIEIKKEDNSLSSLKDKDLIRLEVGALRNKNLELLNLVKVEYARRGLFQSDSESFLSKDVTEKVALKDNR